MRAYELTIIVNPELDDSAFNEIVERVKSWITDPGGEITNIDFWGKRKLAYEINKLTEGNYVLIDTNISPTYCVELERNLGLAEPIMRYLLVSKE
jgi:small subunit ribosomal protein S6